MLILIPGMIFGLTLGYSTEKDAQAFNNGQHLDTWWIFNPQSLLLENIDHIVYHADDVYKGWHVIRPGNEQVPSVAEEIGQNHEAAAYPAIAVSGYQFGPEVAIFRGVVAIAYLSGTIEESPIQTRYPFP